VGRCSVGVARLFRQVVLLVRYVRGRRSATATRYYLCRVLMPGKTGTSTALLVLLLVQTWEAYN